MRTILATSAALLVAACANQPASTMLQAARADLEAARNDAVVTANAPAPLQEAQQSLELAQTAANDGNRLRSDHFAYLTQKRVELARVIAEQRTAEERRRTLADQTAQLQLGARTQEAERARQLAREMQARTLQQQGGDTFIATLDLPFATGTAELQPGAHSRLQPLVKALRENPRERVVIRGHTDDVGSAETNALLSQARADAVRNFLVANGIDANRIVAEGLGESFPIASNATAEGRAQNRRVEVQLSEVPQ
jgi:outer membrane protein OmpA-like peptidoglycan-associated protein